MFTIAGGGFGIYGYLPAIVKLEGEIILPERYRLTVDSRPELHSYRDAILWCESFEAAVSMADSVVLAVTPTSQTQITPSLLKQKHINRLILEKPLSTDPEKARDLLASLQLSQVNYRVGYTFLHTPWFNLIKSNQLQHYSSISIHWRFRANHFKTTSSTWKKLHSQGGGPLRFYGIHLISVLSFLGFTQAVASTLRGATPDEPEEWEAVFQNRNGTQCDICLHTNTAENSFAITGQTESHNRETIFSSASPFNQTNQLSNEDNRICTLEQILRSFQMEQAAFSDLYLSSVQLWSLVEAKTFWP